MAIEGSLGDMLLKVALFVIVQALVYIILSKSSNIFSNDSPLRRSASFKPPRSVSIRRMFAALADIPAGGELSPATSRDAKSLTRKNTTSHHHKT